jgi:alpha-ketoglutarate-dependent taurine dioxygenase
VEARRANPPILRPLIAEHPRTGLRSLYVPSVHIDRLVRLNEPSNASAEDTSDTAAADAFALHERMQETLAVEHGRQLIEELLQHTTSPEFCYAHAWRRGDCVIWDNRCTLHAPSAFDDSKEKRLMWRCVQQEHCKRGEILRALVQKHRARLCSRHPSLLDPRTHVLVACLRPGTSLREFGLSLLVRVIG